MKKSFILGIECSETEICNTDFIVSFIFYRIDKYIVKFYISVNNFFLLEKVESKKHLFHNDSNFTLLEFNSFHYDIHQGSLGLIFEDYAHTILIFIKSKQSEYTHALLQSPVNTDFIQ
jgi:hypothetical protein